MGGGIKSEDQVALLSGRQGEFDDGFVQADGSFINGGAIGVDAVNVQRGFDAGEGGAGFRFGFDREVFVGEIRIRFNAGAGSEEQQTQKKEEGPHNSLQSMFNSFEEYR